MKRTWPCTATLAAALVVAMAGIASAGPNYSAWSPPQELEEIPGNSTQLNTASLDGCPIQSPDGLSLYMASNRPRFAGDTRTDIDIWVATRATTDAEWGDPRNLGEPVNSPADDFCPTPVRGGGLFFVSREEPASCGTADSDIYFTRNHRRRGWAEPQHLGCAPNGPNTAADEQGPSSVDAGGRQLLYFSSGPEIQVSERVPGGRFGPPTPVAELNGPAGDIQPNVRKDGLEIVFASNDSSRPGATGSTFDIYTATRASIDEPFSTPVNLTEVNTSDRGETRPSFSWDGLTLHFGRNPGPEGGSDIFVTTRQKTAGP
jgi:hypothetical protein